METYTFTREEKFLQAQRKIKSIKGFYTHATVFFSVNAFIIIGCALDDSRSLLTAAPYITGLFWVIGLLAHGLSVFGQEFFMGRNWEEKQIEKILNK